jgi:hypothetical protein
MNRRQEVVCWLMGAALSLVSITDGVTCGTASCYINWWSVIFFPILILAPLVVFRLRTRSSSPRLERKAGTTTVVLFLAAGALSYAAHRFTELSDSVDSISSEVSELSRTVGGMERR